MRRAAVAVLASFVAVTACQDLTTTTAAKQDESAIFFGGLSGDNPPPPPIDSGGVGVAEDANSPGTFTNVNLSVTYFLNKPENSGWLKFNRGGDEDVSVDNSAAVKMTNGVYSGKGIIRVSDGSGLFIIDLSKAVFNSGTSFEECTATPTSTDRATCFNLNLSGDGVQYRTKEGGLHPATFRLYPGKVGSDVCIGDTTEECVVTPG